MTEQLLKKGHQATPSEDGHPRGNLWLFARLEEVYYQALHGGKLDICLQSLKQYESLADGTLYSVSAEHHKGEEDNG